MLLGSSENKTKGQVIVITATVCGQ